MVGKLFSPLDFHGRLPPHLTFQKEECFSSLLTRFSRQTHSAVIGILRVTVKKNRKLFQGEVLASRGSLALPQKYPYPSTGILTGFPFNRAESIGTTRGCGSGSRAGRTCPSPPTYSPCFTELPYILGSANSGRNTLLLKPFLTSVNKVPSCLVATATKICTIGHSNPSYEKPSP